MLPRSGVRAAGLALLAGLILPSFGSAAPTPGGAAAGSFVVYVGTFPGANSKGIYRFSFDARTGMPSPAVLAAETPKPGMIALHPNGRFLYAANETDEYQGKPGGSISAYAIREGGQLDPLNVKASGGPGPCFIAIDPTGRCALVAHYRGGSVSALPIGPDGRLGDVATLIQHTGAGIDAERQTHAYAHWIAPDPGNRHALACDLGLDKVICYGFDPATATLTRNDPPFARVRPGSGPRHLAFHPNGRWVYVISEMGSTITLFSYDGARGSLQEIQTVSTLPDDYAGTSTGAEIAVHPNGQFVYGSNRGDDSIVVFAVNRNSGKLKLVQRQPTLGRTPRGFAIDPTGRWLLVGNQDADEVRVFQISPDSGRLAPTADAVGIGAPVCFVFLARR